ncbi:hypothetical protein SUGI_0992690 [Cryptomeria japonica]|nr:hypothetical protein SUGI_0992690 [Cryptomeria japonica]
MSSAHYCPLEIAKFVGVVKQDFWTKISRMVEYQKQHPELYGQIEQDPEWVDVSRFKSEENFSSFEERWLNGQITALESKQM